MNSKHKGKRGELEFAKLCRSQGYGAARRGQQYSGIEGDDVVGLPGVHIEVKRTEALSLYTAMAQSDRDARGNIPIVAHRKNNYDWVIIMKAEDWFALFREWEAGQSLRKKADESEIVTAN